MPTKVNIVLDDDVKADLDRRFLCRRVSAPNRPADFCANAGRGKRASTLPCPTRTGSALEFAP